MCFSRGSTSSLTKGAMASLTNVLGALSQQKCIEKVRAKAINGQMFKQQNPSEKHVNDTINLCTNRINVLAKTHTVPVNANVNTTRGSMQKRDNPHMEGTSFHVRKCACKMSSAAKRCQAQSMVKPGGNPGLRCWASTASKRSCKACASALKACSCSLGSSCDATACAL